MSFPLRLRRVAVVLAGVAALAAVSVSAIGPGSSSASSSGGPLSACPAPHPGSITCFAEFRRIGSRTITGDGGHDVRPDAAAATMPADFTGYTPAQLRAAYGVGSTTTTATIAVVDAYLDPQVAANLATYRSQFGLPACTTDTGCLTQVNQSGDASPLPTATNSSWTGETDLDVEMVSALCPTCHILLVETDDTTTLFDGVAAAVRLGAHYVSMSWGGTDWSGSPSYTSAYFATPGVAFVAASGDSGYGADYPATSPDVLAVGGTSLVPAGTARGYSETVWNDGDGWATASGCAVSAAKPSWQAVVPSSACTTRATNDVAVDADPNTGVSVYSAANGGWVIAGGTSAGAPMVTAMYAVAGSLSTSETPAAYPYGHSGGFTDVTSGSDGTCSPAILCTATAGWDGPTGLGTPTTTADFAVPAPLVLHNPGTVRDYVGIATAVNVTAAGTGATKYAATGLPPGITLSSDGYLTGVPTRAGSYRVTVSASRPATVGASTTFVWVASLNTIVATPAPRVTGTVRPGHAVAVSGIAWRRDGATGVVIHPTVHYQWYVNGRAVSGATRASWLIPNSSNYLRHTVQVRITASATYYSTYSVVVSAVIT